MKIKPSIEIQAVSETLSLVYNNAQSLQGIHHSEKRYNDDASENIIFKCARALEKELHRLYVFETGNVDCPTWDVQAELSDWLQDTILTPPDEVT
tara:strand:- start:466 stop:750 length:285 start_codon:yes stop_codon:yes gene_type:complete